MRIGKNFRSGIVIAFIALFVCATAMAASVYADETGLDDFIKWDDFTKEANLTADPAPLVFDETTASTSGAGWTWENDSQEKILTLDGFKMTLKDYTDPYEAGITLPGGATIVVQNDSGLQVTKRPGNPAYPVAILANGDLTIKGNATFVVDGENGADGIQADGNIRVGEGKDPAKGLQFQARATGFAMCAGKSVSFTGAGVNVGILDLKKISKDELKGVILAGVGNDAQDEYAVDIRDCNCKIFNQNIAPETYGIYAGNGSVRINNSNYRHVAEKQDSMNTIGIRACNGNVDMEHSDVTMQLSTYTGSINDPSMISAESGGSQAIPSPMITISDSLVQGYSDAIGLSAEGIVIGNGSDVDLTTIGPAITAAGEGLSIAGSEVELISTDDSINTVFAAGPVKVDASEIYITGKGSESVGLNTISTVDISGDTSLDIDATLAAVQAITTSDNSPITLQGNLDVRDGGTLQYVDGGGNIRIYSYSEGTLDQGLQNASKRVLITNDSRMIFIEQPEDAIVKYPAGASFEVRLTRADKIASYQWYARDIVGNVFELTGDSAKTSELIVPSTGQRDNLLVYYCVVTDTAGNKLVSKEAYLDKSNKREDKPVLYVGNYALEPGQTLNLNAMPAPQIGTGTISFDKNGKDITFDNVRMDNSRSIYDVRLSQAMCVRLDQAGKTEGTYTLKLKGKNILTNYFQDSSGNGITLDFLLRGQEPQQPPTVVIDGETLGGTLTVKGGAQAIRATASMVVNADVTVQKTRDSDISYMDAIVCYQLNGQGQHDMTIGAGHKLDITSFGSGLTTPGAMTIGENAQIDIDMTMPYIYVAPGAGASQVLKSAIFVGTDKLELKPGTKLNITGVVDPAIMTNISECDGILLQNGASMVADGSTINIAMTAKPYVDPIYVGDIYGISSTSSVTLKDSSVSISVDGDEWVYAGSGIVADKDITMNNCKADISASGNMQAFGIVTDTNVTMDNCEADVASTADVAAYGIAPNKDLKVTASKINAKTKYISSGGSSYGILGSNMNLDVSTKGSYIKADATNDNGLAFVANTGDAGSDKRSYDPSYKAKMIKGNFDVAQPQNAVVNIASIPGSVHKYMYVESFYDTKDTSKPAVSAELAKNSPTPVVKTVTVNSNTVTTAALNNAVQKAGGTSATVTTIVLGKNVKKIGKGVFKNYKNAKTLVVKTKKLKKAKVRNSLKGSSVTKVKVSVGKKATNKKYVKKYKKIFTKKNAGKKVKVSM